VRYVDTLPVQHPRRTATSGRVLALEGFFKAFEVELSFALGHRELPLFWLTSSPELNRKYAADASELYLTLGAGLPLFTEILRRKIPAMMQKHSKPQTALTQAGLWLSLWVGWGTRQKKRKTCGTYEGAPAGDPGEAEALEAAGD
jgi:hypothetical protein